MTTLKHDMTVGKPWKIILLFTLPVIAGNIFQQLYSLADTLIVGRTLGGDALAAVGCTGAASYFVLSFIQGYTTGFSVITGKRFGAKDYAGVKRSFLSTLLLSTVSGVLLTLAFTLLTRPLLSMLGTPAEIADEAYDYLVVIFAGTLATVFYNMTSNVARALGDSAAPLVFLVFSSLLNVGLDLLFILVFNTGVAGAAWATVISQFAAALSCWIYILVKFPVLRLHKDDFHLDKANLWAHCRLGFPMGLQLSVMSIGHVAVQSALNRLGKTAVEAFTMASKIDNVAVQIDVAFCTSVPPYVAQNFGARKPSRIRRGVAWSLVSALGLSVLCSLAIGLFGRPMLGLFTVEADAEVMRLAVLFLNIIIMFYPLLAVLCVFRSAVQGLGKTAVPFTACLIELVCRVGAAFLLGGLWGYIGVCFATPLAWAGAAIFLTFGYFLTMRGTFRPRRGGKFKLSGALPRVVEARGGYRLARGKRKTRA